jgi:hypothetical protein
VAGESRVRAALAMLGAASTILLAEPFSGVTSAALVYGVALTPIQGLAAALVLLATLNEVRRANGRVARRRLATARAPR